MLYAMTIDNTYCLILYHQIIENTYLMCNAQYDNDDNHEENETNFEVAGLGLSFV